MWVWRACNGIERDSFSRALPKRRYERVSRQTFAGGFVQ